MRLIAACIAMLLLCPLAYGADMPATTQSAWSKIERYFRPPGELAGKLGEYRPVLKFEDGREVKTPQQWQERRKEILEKWQGVMGAWPALLERPELEIVSSEQRDGFTQHKVRVQVAEKQKLGGYLLVPPGKGPFPAVLVVFYDAETGAGLNPKGSNLDYAYQLARRGFVTLSIEGMLGLKSPQTGETPLQPLSYHAYGAANCHTALSQLPYVDGKRIGVVGHSYGGKWSLFAACLYEKFAACVTSDPGIVFDEARGNVNYWEPWYLGFDPGVERKRGMITAEAPRTGAYKTMMEKGMDLHELHALMAPRPLLVSGGSEDPVERWVPLNQLIAVDRLLGVENRVGMTNRPEHSPDPLALEVVYAFFQHFLQNEANGGGD